LARAGPARNPAWLTSGRRAPSGPAKRIAGKADQPRPFRVPGGTFGLWLTSGLGIAGALLALTIGFFPPEQLAATGLRTRSFVSFLGGGLVLSVSIPLVVFRFRRPGWRGSRES